MDATERIKSLLEQRGWTAYRLSKSCGLSENTIATILKRNSLPSIGTLESICKGFGITLSEFFAEGDLIEVSSDTKQLIEYWGGLSPTQKKTILRGIEHVQHFLDLIFRHRIKPQQRAIKMYISGY